VGRKTTTASLDPASYETKIVSDHETISAPYRTKPRLAREAKAKALCAYSEATTASLASTIVLGSDKPAACEAKAIAPLDVIETGK